MSLVVKTRSPSPNLSSTRLLGRCFRSALRSVISGFVDVNTGPPVPITVSFGAFAPLLGLNSSGTTPLEFVFCNGLFCFGSASFNLSGSNATAPTNMFIGTGQIPVVVTAGVSTTHPAGSFSHPQLESDLAGLSMAYNYEPIPEPNPALLVVILSSILFAEKQRHRTITPHSRS